MTHSPNEGTEKVAAIAAQLRRPRFESVTIRRLIGWYGYKYRSMGLNRRIKRGLSEAGLYVRPDFGARVGPHNHNYRYALDHQVRLLLRRTD